MPGNAHSALSIRECAKGGTMAGRVEDIYRLQTIDGELDEKRETLHSVESQLEDSQEVLAARKAVREEEQILRERRRRLRSLELDLEEISAKISAAEGVLYGGEVTNPKELAGMEQEADYLRRRRSAVEDEALLIMGEVDEQEDALRNAQEHLACAEQEWEALREVLRKDVEELGSRLIFLEAERAEISKRIPEKDLAAYTALRRQKGGQAVALLENGVCQGCRVALPTSVVQRVRRGDEIVYCGSCQRILYAAR
jgi:predicted  nucleic acid-binding Zn-ribbon protein